MPLINFDDYKPGALFRRAHFNTMYPAFFRRQCKPKYERVRIDTPDDDFLDLDFIKKGNNKVAMLCHGLEGSSASQYIVAISRLLSKNGWDVLAMNYRSCGGEVNRQPMLYHGGATYDLVTVIKYLEKSYEHIDLIGYSLGGNLALKYLGEDPKGVSKKINKVVAVSAPIELGKASIQISRPSNWHYNKSFRDSLVKKLLRKNKITPEISVKNIDKVKTLRDFDDRFTAPYHGFKDAWDYYSKCQSIQFLPFVKKETLLINALDDPFLPKECYPFELLKKHKYIHFAAPRYGGHLGFANFNKEFYWIEEKILSFLKFGI